MIVGGAELLPPVVDVVMVFVLLRGAFPAQAANLVALGLTAIAHTAANRRITFGIRGRPGAARAQLQGLGLGLWA
ncbi:MAG: hypothetical protein JWP46_3874 [Modestobacter sp.]|nr:hypothetical protein [Modestobacter sp.]